MEKHPDDVNPVQHFEDHNYSLGQCDGHIMTETTDIGEQSTNHLINLPNMIAYESTEKQDITNPLELYNMTLEDDIECINDHSHEVTDSDNEVLESSGSEYFPSDCNTHRSKQPVWKPGLSVTQVYGWLGFTNSKTLSFLSLTCAIS